MSVSICRKRWIGRTWIVWAALLVSTLLVALRLVHGARPAMTNYRGKVTAPEFPEKLDWLNTDRPLTLKQLRGKVVLLDFWTYCCINCMHVLPDLKRLEGKYAEELVVVGVHSAKFAAESQTENIRQAILRYEIEHPVINDHGMILWRQYGIRAWPSVVLIDPAGKVVGYSSGEGVYERYDSLIAKVIKTFDQEGGIDRRPLALKLERDRAPRSALSFPGKVLADAGSNQLFIADSNHNRIVVLSLDDYSVKAVIGSGKAGLADGDFERARFNHPQGMAFDGKTLYVADTENHAIRSVDPRTRNVATIAGTGGQARQSNVAGPGRTTALNSPWDLVLHNGGLYIAMAGSHQIWQLDLKSNRVAPYAGSGREGRIDGRLASAALAQPSGLTTDGRKLYFADSEVSAVRSADLDPLGRVRTLVGGELFTFGDLDGRGLSVRLQHPLGVVHHDGFLYVADTYNNKLKRISVAQRTAETFLGTGKAGFEDGNHPAFDEPAGVSIANGTLYIADTNNHVIRVADLRIRRVETLQLKNAERLWPEIGSGRAQQARALPEQTVKPGKATLTITLDLPRGHKVSPDAPSFVTVTSSDGGTLALGAKGEQTFKMPRFPVVVPLQASEGRDSVRIRYAIYYCTKRNEGLCYFDGADIVLPVVVRNDAGGRDLQVPLKLNLP